MKSLRLLLQTLVSFWDIGEEAFLIQGQHVEITMLDVYFFTRLPMLGIVHNLVPVLSRGETLEELCERHCYATAYMRGLHILMCDIEDVSRQAIATMLLRILGSTGSHKISRGQLQIVEHAMGGTYYAWAQMYLQVVRHHLNNARVSGGVFCFGSFLCAFFFEKVPTLCLHQAM